MRNRPPKPYGDHAAADVRAKLSVNLYFLQATQAQKRLPGKNATFLPILAGRMLLLVNRNEGGYEGIDRLAEQIFIINQ